MHAPAATFEGGIVIYINLQSLTVFPYVANELEISFISNLIRLLDFNNVFPSVFNRFPISKTSSIPVL